MQQICLVSLINNSYIIPFKVFLKSLIKYNKSLNLDYIVFYDNNVVKKDLNDLTKIYNNLKFLPIEASLYNGFKFDGNRSWEMNPAYRLEIFKLNYDKIIYFDVDAICLKPIDEILALDYSFAGVRHELHDLNQIKSLFRFKSSSGFNGGFLIIKKIFLSQNTINKIVEIFNSSLWYGNQGPLNICFKKEAVLLENKYFLPITHANLKNIKSAFFIHFLGEKKPWFEGDIYSKYSMQVLKNVDYPTIFKLQEIYNSYLKSIHESGSSTEL